MVTSNILDPIQTSLPPNVWENPDDPEPVLKPQHAHWITTTIYGILERGGYSKPHEWLKLYMTGSLCTWQYGPESDVDVGLFVQSAKLPEWSRSEMIGLMIEGTEGQVMPGTTYELQAYVVAQRLHPTDLYKRGLRAGYSIDSHKWIVPPDPALTHDTEAQENGFYTWALEQADKMERLIRYEPDKAKLMWHHIHKRRMRDQVAGKGDHSESNILFKFLFKRGLAPALRELTGEHIGGKTAEAIDHQSVLDANVGQDLQGLPGPVNVPNYGPLQFHSNAEMQNMAQSYNQQYGIQQQHPTDYTRVNPQIAQQVAAEFERTPHAPNDPNVQAAYQAFAKEVRQQYDHTINHGYNFEFYPQGQDPYPNSPREALLDLHHNKHMYVYPTHEGFGSEADPDFSDHPMLGDSGVRWNGQPVTHNDLFRAIHDVYGHAKEGVGFRADGEENAFRQHAAMFSPLAQRALTTETRGQNNWINHGPYGEQNQKANTQNTIFAQNRAGLMPEWVGNPDLFKQQSTHMAWGYDWTKEHAGMIAERDKIWNDAYRNGQTVLPRQQFFDEYGALSNDGHRTLNSPAAAQARGDYLNANVPDISLQGYPRFDDRAWMQSHHDQRYNSLMNDPEQDSGAYERWLTWYYQHLQSRGYDPFEFGRNAEPSSGTFAKVASMFQPITQDEARGNSRPVSMEEFQQLASEGKAMHDAMASNLAPITGLEQNWGALKDQAHQEVLKPWGGMTIDSHTGVPLQSDGDLYALTARSPDMRQVSMPENPSRERFHAAMDRARHLYRPLLERADHHLGVFHDDAEGRVDIDPITVVNSPEEVERLGAYTHATGGAYHFRTGDGYFPPHVRDPVGEHDIDKGLDIPINPATVAA